MKFLKEHQKQTLCFRDVNIDELFEAHHHLVYKLQQCIKLSNLRLNN